MPWIPSPSLCCAVAIVAAGCLMAVATGQTREWPSVEMLPANPELPDPLMMFDGTRVTTRRQWRMERRPELKRLFEHYMYGTAPPPPRNLKATLEREDPRFFGGKATERQVTLRFGPKDTPPIHLLLLIPNRRSSPAPAFAGLAFCRNYAVVDDPTLPRPAGAKDPRGSQRDTWNVEQSIDRGYAVATFFNGDVEPDDPNATTGVRASYRPVGRWDWGTIAAWAWGIQRVVDYLRTVPDIDRRRIAAVGHSRNGKAALLAAAFDERIALAIPLQAGCGGTAPSRGTVGESVQAINDRFPHWFNARFKRFNNRPERLPFDQNGLLALVAPRPVLFSNATEDTWANPAGQFEVLRGADPVYRFLGVDGLGAQQMPPTGELLNSRLGYFVRPGQHSMTRVDWNAFLDYADQWLKAPE